MKQYCRYCAYCVGDTGYVNTSYCAAKSKEMSSNTAKRENNCKQFVFNPIDAFNIENGRYKPREKREKKDNGQLSLFEVSV